MISDFQWSLNLWSLTPHKFAQFLIKSNDLLNLFLWWHIFWHTLSHSLILKNYYQITYVIVNKQLQNWRKTRPTKNSSYTSKRNEFWKQRLVLVSAENVIYNKMHNPLHDIYEAQCLGTQAHKKHSCYWTLRSVRWWNHPHILRNPGLIQPPTRVISAVYLNQ